MDPRLLATALTLLLALSGCRANCQDACDRLADCGETLRPGSRPDEAQLNRCVTDCQEGLCGPNRAEQSQQAVECIADLACDSEAQVERDLLGCLARCL
ncbi:MAG: hypothetical protein ACK4N5_07590 [Myxococcales bacterium]